MSASFTVLSDPTEISMYEFCKKIGLPVVASTDAGAFFPLRLVNFEIAVSICVFSESVRLLPLPKPLAS